MLLNPRTADPLENDRPSVSEQLWLVGSSAAVLLVGYALCAGVIALVMTTARGAHVTAAAVVIGGVVAWLCAHQVPLAVGGAVLTVLPLVPTVLAAALVAGASRWVARRLEFYRPEHALVVVVSMALPHAAAGGSAAVLVGNGIPVVDAFLCSGFTAAVGAAIGVARPCGLVFFVRESLPEEVWAGLRRGLFACWAVLGAGAVTAVAGTLLSLARLQTALGALPGGDAFGESVLSLLYAPNAAVAGWSFATGTGLSVGRYALQPWHVDPGRLPDLPLFSALAQSGPHWWWFAALALPLVVSGFVGWSCRAVCPDPRRRMRAVAVAALVPSLVALLAGAVAGGSVAAFDPIGPRPVVLAAATFCWIAVPAALITWFAGPREVPRAR